MHHKPVKEGEGPGGLVEVEEPLVRGVVGVADGGDPAEVAILWPGSVLEIWNHHLEGADRAWTMVVLVDEAELIGEVRNARDDVRADHAQVHVQGEDVLRVHDICNRGEIVAQQAHLT